MANSNNLMTTSGGSNSGGGAAVEDFKEIRKTKKGSVESADVKARFNLAADQPINHIACNQTQEYFAVATNIGFEIVQNDSSSARLKKKS